MVGFQLRPNPLRKLKANFRDLESRIYLHCHKKQVVIQAAKEIVLYKTCDKIFSLVTSACVTLKNFLGSILRKKIFYPNGKLKVNCCRVSREGFCCSLTRKALFYITSDAFFGTAKTCIINTKCSERFETFHTTKCIMQLHQTQVKAVPFPTL